MTSALVFELRREEMIVAMMTGAARVGGGPGVLGALSDDARSALLGAGVSREGAVVQGRAVAVQELQLAGLAGRKRGLTVAGVNARARLVEQMMQELF